MHGESALNVLWNRPMPKATWNGKVLAQADAAKHVKGYVAF